MIIILETKTPQKIIYDTCTSIYYVVPGLKSINATLQTEDTDIWIDEGFEQIGVPASRAES